MRCYRCHSTEKLLKHAVSTDGVQSYVCRKCNSQKMAAYYKTKKGKANIAANQKRMREKHRVKHRARSYLGMCVAKGKVSKPIKCETCGKKEVRIEGHHEDYSKPLEVNWFCTDCHADRHRFMKRVAQDRRGTFIEKLL